uniref:Uncharacterized protein n=1 Tax=Tetranychus urticae TaxID=32264 RepID=T1KMQ7_TETUR
METSDSVKDQLNSLPFLKVNFETLSVGSFFLVLGVPQSIIVKVLSSKQQRGKAYQVRNKVRITNELKVSHQMVNSLCITKHDKNGLSDTLIDWIKCYSSSINKGKKELTNAPRSNFNVKS